MKEKNVKKSRVIWSLLFVVIAAASVFAVTTEARDFSFDDFAEFISRASVPYLLCAVACMLGYIFFEGAALTLICRSFGFGCRHRDGIAYSATDLYFSAITPSASGGQPACAYFMMRDGIPGIFATVALLVNLVMFVAAILLIGVICFLLAPDLFLGFSVLSRVLIVFGCAVQIALLFGFLLLLKKEKLLRGICGFFLRLLAKTRLSSRVPAMEEKLDRKMAKFAEYSGLLDGKRRMLFRVFLLNLFQRVCSIAVTAFSYLAAGGNLGEALRVFLVQGYVVIGATSIPIPGAMGVTDYMMLDGLEAFAGEEAVIHLELLSRSISFYACVVLCGLIAVIKFIASKQKGRNEL